MVGVRALDAGAPRSSANAVPGWAVSQGEMVDYTYAGGLDAWSTGLRERCRDKITGDKIIATNHPATKHSTTK